MRSIKPLNHGWQFGVCDRVGENEPVVASWELIELPHVWNLADPRQEGPRAYRCSLDLETPDEQHQYFVSFGAVAGVCRVWLNGQFLGEHRGGYSCFRFALGKAARPGLNELTVLADNTRFSDIIPLGGDFNNYGGIYREVELICTGETHFDLMYHGTNGLNLTAQPDGTVNIASRIVSRSDAALAEYTILDHGRECASCQVTAATDEAVLKVDQPHLWQGLSDPHLYQFRARLMVKNECVDEVSMSFGFRAIAMTPDKGFFLNGEHLRINGVCKHQDRHGRGCAPTRTELDEDLCLIREVGANAVRLSHYQHPQYIYDLCDRSGLVAWAEIPMLAMPDGNDALIENAMQQMKELVLQNKHHPSICFWGIQNEIALMGESLEMYRKTEQLNRLVKELDPDRITASANLYTVKNNSQFNHITDMVGYNIYFGWYYGEMEKFGPFLDSFHDDNPTVALGVSEYGVDCSTTLHSSTPKRKDYSEDFQSLFHETVYPVFCARSWLWGSFVWNMFDFGSARRNEGGMTGENRKGLVTFDRKIKKDAFYFYKAQWSADPFIYIAGRRYANRCEELTTIKVYANVDEVTLIVNGEQFACLKGKCVFNFPDVPLQKGANQIKVLAGELQDEIILSRVEQPEQSYIFIDPNPGFNVNNWFTLDQSQEDFFPEDHYSIMDEMGKLMENPQVWALLEQKLPQIANMPRNRIMPGISLLRLINRMSSLFDEDAVKQLNQDLNKIEKHNN